MKRLPIPRAALLAFVSLLTLALSGVPVAVYQSSAAAAKPAAGAATWTGEPSADALLKPSGEQAVRNSSTSSCPTASPTATRVTIGAG